MNRTLSRRFFQFSILLFIGLVCVYFFLHSSFFYIDKIEVTGANKVTQEEIKEISDIKLGDNIFEVDNRLSSRSIETHPMIKKVQIIRHLPRKLEIKVAERQLWAIVPYEGVFLGLDEEGICIDRMINLPSGNYRLVTLDNPPQRVNLGYPVQSEGIDTIRQIDEAISETSRNNISEYHYQSKSKEVLVFTLKGTEVRFGNLERLKEKAVQFEQIFAMESELEENGTGAIQYVDIRFEGNPVLKVR